MGKSFSEAHGIGLRDYRTEFPGACCRRGKSVPQFQPGRHVIGRLVPAEHEFVDAGFGMGGADRVRQAKVEKRADLLKRLQRSQRRPPRDRLPRPLVPMAEPMADWASAFSRSSAVKGPSSA